MTIQKPTKGKLLIAEPSIIGDVSFNRSVVLLTDHSEKGSMGFILNKPLGYTLEELIPEITSGMLIYNGGPVDQDNLYFIHKVPELIPNSEDISEGIYWGGNFDKVVELIASGGITEKEILFFLGYSGWDSDQLDHELNSKSWVVVENVDKKDLINKDLPDLWREKMVALGGDYVIWSNAPEHPGYN